jgi:hypothetical protein
VLFRSQREKHDPQICVNLDPSSKVNTPILAFTKQPSPEHQENENWKTTSLNSIQSMILQCSAIKTPIQTLAINSEMRGAGLAGNANRPCGNDRLGLKKLPAPRARQYRDVLARLWTLGHLFISKRQILE